MADNIILNAGDELGPEIATDEISDVHYPISKLAHGALDAVTLVSAASGLPVAQQGTWNIATVTAVTDITNTVTVDGTVTAELGATDNAVLDTIAASVAAADVDLTTIIGHVDGLEALIGTTNTSLTTVIGHVDGVEGLLTTIDADTGDAVTALQVIDNIVLVEDSGHSSGHSGVMMLGVRNDAAGGMTSDDGDYSPITVTSSGAVRVQITGTVALPTGAATSAKQDEEITLLTTIAGDTTAIEAAVEGTLTVAGTVDLGATDNAVLDAIAASVAAIDTDTSTLITAAQLLDDTVYVDGAAWTDDTSKHLLTGGVYLSTPQTVTDGDTAPFLIDANGRLEVVATVEASESASDYAEDSPHTSTDVGAFVLAVRNDARTPLAANGDYIPFSTGADGALHVFDETTFDAVDSTVTLLQGISDFTSFIESVAYLDDADWTDGGSYHVLTGGLYQSTPQTVTDGDVAPFNITANGALHVAVQGTAAVSNAGLTELAAAINGSSQMDVNIAASAATVTVANAGLTELAAAINGSSQMDVNIAASGATVPVSNAGLTELASAIYAEDVGHTGADPGMFALGVRYDTPITALTNTDADYTAITTDKVGGIRTALYETDFAVLGTNHVKKYLAVTGAQTDQIIWSPAAGKRWYVTDIYIQTSAAAVITLEDDKAGGDEVVWAMDAAANSGWSHSFQTPLFSGEDAADLIITNTAGNLKILVTGYEV